MAEEVLIEATSAALGGVVSSTALFPLEVIKTKMQAMGSSTSSPLADKSPARQSSNQDEGEAESKTTGTNPAPHPATMATIGREIYAASGVAGFYKGVSYSALQSAMEKVRYSFGQRE